MSVCVNVINNGGTPASSLKRITDTITTTLQMMDPDINCTVNLKISGAAEIVDYNKRYFNKESVTDVISFTFNDKDPETDEWILGDIIICRDVAEKEAAARGKSTEEELALYAAHGTLHLLGYTDETEKKRQTMFDLQDKALARIYD